MKVISLAAVIVVSVANLSAQGVKADYYLDIPGHTHTPISAGWFSPSRNGASITPHAMLPASLKLTLLSVDRTDLVYGDYFNFEVLIENIGREPMTFPWSPNAGEFWQPTPRIPDGFLSGLVSLHAESVDGQAVLLSLLEAQPLYGSNEVPRSLLRLMPGRAARIRVPTQLSAAMPEGRARIFQQPEGAIRVRAVFSMRIDNFPLTRSTNTIPIRVFPRQLQ